MMMMIFKMLRIMRIKRLMIYVSALVKTTRAESINGKGRFVDTFQGDL